MFITAPLASARAFTRYAFAVQYHGGKFLGFSYQGRRGENCIVYDEKQSVQVDLRGIESVEGRVRRALDRLVGIGNYANVQVSSRTDRGVHAWRNTFQVDIRPRLHSGKERRSTGDGRTATNEPPTRWRPKNLVSGLNFYLSRLPSHLTDKEHGKGRNSSYSGRNDNSSYQNDPIHNNICILSSAVAPSTTIPNKHYDPNLPEHEIANPPRIPWDVRFTATRRTYAYQILHSYDGPSNLGNGDTHHSSACYHSQPFEHDRVWRIHDTHIEKQTNGCGLDVGAMNLAGRHLVGTHDFTSFRGKGCQRSSPVVTLEDVCVNQNNYGNGCGGIISCIQKSGPEDGKENARDILHAPSTLHLVTIVITGKSFLYRQVRNIVACLVDVGRGRLKPADVKEILEERDRSCTPGMAPSKGLFLVDVEHGNRF
ncbi:hypothetical protein ACHAWF_004653 [Thalassiosira exigua]